MHLDSCQLGKPKEEKYKNRRQNLSECRLNFDINTVWRHANSKFQLFIGLVVGTEVVDW